MAKLRNTCEVPLVNGGVAIIDKDDYERVIRLGKWYKSSSGYAVRQYSTHQVFMHRFIIGTPEGLLTDHINHNRLDNRKRNLRIVNAAINSQNGAGVTRSVNKDMNLPKYITFVHSLNRYQATRITKKRFKTLEEAINYLK